MTDQSREDAVLEAIGDLVRDGRSSYEITQAAIEANDAWLESERKAEIIAKRRQRIARNTRRLYK